ncbi:hypothetical protein OAM01_00060 [bacterium]|nr:hypothetical protein [bacterium]
MIKKSIVQSPLSMFFMLLVCIFHTGQCQSITKEIYVSVDGGIGFKEGSPALTLGIEPLDVSKMGRITAR